MAYLAINGDDEAITLIVDDLDYAILADWKYKEE